MHLHLISQTDNWEKCETCDYPKVYFSNLPSGKDFQIKTEFTVDVSIDNVLAYLQKIPEYCDWVFNCKSTTLLSKSSKTSGIYRSIIGTPWPFKDNEVYMQYSFKEVEKNKVWRLYQKCLPNFAPINENLERITRFKAVWEISVVSENKTKIVYFAETGGPKNMIKPVKNVLLCTAPNKTVNALISQIMNSKF